MGELLFSLSKAAGDFVVKTARSSGPGGQNVNKRSKGSHLPSCVWGGLSVRPIAHRSETGLRHFTGCSTLRSFVHGFASSLRSEASAASQSVKGGLLDRVVRRSGRTTSRVTR